MLNKLVKVVKVVKVVNAVHPVPSRFTLLFCLLVFIHQYDGNYPVLG